MTSSDFNAALYSGYFSYCIFIVKLTTPMKPRKKNSQGRFTTSNIGVSIISLHDYDDTPRRHTLKRVIRNLIVWRTYK